MSQSPRIIVGVDGSEGSRKALKWARDEAFQQGASLLAITAWTSPPPQVEAPYASFPWGFDVQPEKNAQQVLSETLENVLGETPGVPLQSDAREGNAAKVLIDASKGADLVVVGCRGHGGFAGLLLGSVSQQVSAHSACTVVVVR